MAGKKKNSIPLSGDRLVDTLFRIIIDVLEKEVEAIRMKKVLRDPDNRRRELRGLLTDQKSGEIYLGKSAHTKTQPPIVAALTHEVLHTAIKVAFERRIGALEDILMVRLTDAQKRYLRSYIPRHTVKQEPEDKKDQK